MSRSVRRLAVTAVLVVLGALSAAGLGGAAVAQGPLVPALTGIRTGVNAGFDRVVLDLTAGPAPAVSARTGDELTADPSGEVVWLTGQYFVTVSASPAAAHDAGGVPTYGGPAKFRTPALRNVMAVAVTGDFEGHLSVGLGVRSRTTVNVFTLTSPNRVVVDVGY